MKYAKVESVRATVTRPDTRVASVHPDQPQGPCVTVGVSRGLPSGKLDWYWMTASQARRFAIELLQAAEYSER